MLPWVHACLVIYSTWVIQQVGTLYSNLLAQGRCSEGVNVGESISARQYLDTILYPTAHSTSKQGICIHIRPHEGT